MRRRARGGGLGARRPRAPAGRVARRLGRLTRTLEAPFSGRADQALAEVDVVVAPEQAIEDSITTADTVPTVPPALLEQVRVVDGVALAAGQVFAAGWIFDGDGEPLGSSLAPDLLQAVLPDRLGGQQSRLRSSGRPPSTA